MWVVGADGQVGGALCEALGPGRAVRVVRSATAREDRVLDLEELPDDPDRSRDLLRDGPVRAVVIAAGFTWVDGCEDEPERSHRVNCIAPAVIARAARHAGARTVYYSTEYVFDGTAGPYGEDDPVRPRSVYGQSKLDGERAVLDSDPEALVLRTTVVYGPELKGRNFAYRLAEGLRDGKPVRVPEDQVSSPTYNRDLAAATLALIEKGVAGILHVAGDCVMSRLDFARRLAKAANLDPRWIEPVSSAALGQRAERPLRAGLSIERLQRLLPKLRLHSVEAAVEDWRRRPRGRPWPIAAQPS